MSDFLADLQSYFASEQRAREAELADARPAFEQAEYAGRLDRDGNRVLSTVPRELLVATP
jgi:hypothetical protein